MLVQFVLRPTGRLLGVEAPQTAELQMIAEVFGGVREDLFFVRAYFQFVNLK